MDDTANPFLNPAATAVDRQVGSQLQRQRLHHGLSAITVAQALGVCESSLDRWERGQFRIPACHLLSLSRLFSCPLATFFEGLSNDSAEGDAEPLDGDVASVSARQHDAKH